MADGIQARYAVCKDAWSLGNIHDPLVTHTLRKCRVGPSLERGLGCLGVGVGIDGKEHGVAGVGTQNGLQRGGICSHDLLRIAGCIQIFWVEIKAETLRGCIGKDSHIREERLHFFGERGHGRNGRLGPGVACEEFRIDRDPAAELRRPRVGRQAGLDGGGGIAGIRIAWIAVDECGKRWDGRRSGTARPIVRIKIAGRCL